MPDIVNKREHAVRVATEGGGPAARLRSGQVGTFEGETADRLLAIEGVENATSEDQENWDNLRMASSMSAETSKGSLNDAINEARTAGRVAGVVIPNNTVIGDDDAPIGPPSGTITTKVAVRRLGDAEARAFGNLERFPEEADNEKLSEVERTQAEMQQLAEEVHNEVLDQASEDGIESATTSPESSGSLSSGGLDQTGNPSGTSSDGEDGELKGKELDDALREKNLSTSGTVAEKRERLASS